MISSLIVLAFSPILLSASTSSSSIAILAVSTSSYPVHLVPLFCIAVRFSTWPLWLLLGCLLMISLPCFVVIAGDAPSLSFFCLHICLLLWNLTVDSAPCHWPPTAIPLKFQDYIQLFIIFARLNRYPNNSRFVYITFFTRILCLQFLTNRRLKQDKICLTRWSYRWIHIRLLYSMTVYLHLNHIKIMSTLTNIYILNNLQKTIRH